MTFKELEYLLKVNDKINISELAKELNVSRQTIHSWKQKNSIPKKYRNNIMHISNRQKDIKAIQIDIEIDYKKEFILLGDNINLKDGKLEIWGLNEFGEHITKEFKSDRYKSREQENNEHNNFYIIERYETEIDYENQIIKYRLYCVHPGTGLLRMKYIFNNKKLSRYFSMFKTNLYNKVYDNYNFKAIINYVKFIEKDIVIDLSKEKFYEIYKLFNDMYIEKSIIQPMGFYIKADRCIYERLNEFLEEEINEYKNRNFTYLNCIFICSEIIKENINFLILDKNDIDKISKITKGTSSSSEIDFVDLYKLVLAHELGHLIFSYSKSNNPTFEEKRDNYIVSNLFDNKYDLFNKYLTTHQPYIYNDILIKPETKKMYENIDSTIISSLKILEYEKYYNEVEKLYE